MIFKSVLNKRTDIIFFHYLRDYDLNGCAKKTEFRVGIRKFRLRKIENKMTANSLRMINKFSCLNLSDLT